MWLQEKFEDTKAVIRSRKWTKDRQYLKENDELTCPGSESSTYTTGGIPSRYSCYKPRDQ